MISRYINTDLKLQNLELVLNDKVFKYYPISSSIYGAGESKNSYMTPRGKHIIRAKIGKDKPIGSVFVNRRVTGETYNEGLRLTYPNRDWILTRIIWLSGIEVGRNRLGNVDTMQRYIYIHGCPDNEKMGKIGSKGCIRMTNKDILDLFELVHFGMSVIIRD